MAENNRALEEQNNVFSEQNTQLEASVTDLKESAAKFKEVYAKLCQENEKLSAVRDGLQDQLNVSISYLELTNFNQTKKSQNFPKILFGAMLVIVTGK